MSLFGVQTWPSWDAYQRYLADEREWAKEDARKYQEARETFCSHGKDLIQRCIDCEKEV